MRSVLAETIDIVIDKSQGKLKGICVDDGVMVLLERDGKRLDGDRGQLELISAEDYFAGSRYVRGLRDIEVVLVQ